ncbi:Uncharacterised protein [uncultured Roseburia sp.]|uniref:Uncharacterized protein n=1 Tax=Brotonthovivens ammoniilytica TaxID=2981725 RepID=A0ABT2TK62_9FIRM|nr:hypothetical protein [Brotonthovivens ammoniilytica]MCU6762546.1 hypothetical protein [Brotonthovivens ammoniilytica]SCI75254.1 Uncharacterised protein [uncultured Roseburia sp.]
MMTDGYDSREIEEAIEAGWQAKNTLESAIDALESAAGWGVWDLLGGNLFSGMMKHSRMDDAQVLVEEAQRKLRRFQRELNDVHLAPELKVNMEGFSRMADYLFDNVFLDMFVQSKIRNNIRELKRAVTEIEQVLSWLRVQAEI